MTFQSPIVEKTGTIYGETIHIMHGCTMHLHGHQNKVLPLMKLFILVDFNNDVKFHNYTCWSINDTPSHHLPHHVNNHHIATKT